MMAYKFNYKASRHAFLCIFATLVAMPFTLVQSAEGTFALADKCPPSFALDNNNQCQLRNLYQLYDSLQNDSFETGTSYEHLENNDETGGAHAMVSCANSFLGYCGIQKFYSMAKIQKVI